MRFTREGLIETVMNRQIWKFQVPFDEVCIVEMPLGARVVFVGEQNDAIYLWAEVDPAHRKVVRKFAIVGTGQSIPEDLEYVGTVQTPPFVWHVYEEG
jgi:hypothetical protein